MNRAGRHHPGTRTAPARRLPVLLAALALLAADTARADHTEVRDFAVYVDGKHVGHNRLSVTTRDDGTTHVSNVASVKVKMFLVTFTFSYQGTEIWREPQLVQAEGRCQENRKTYDLTATLEPGGQALRVRVNGREQRAPADVWTACYWKLPPVRERVQAVTVLKTNTGELVPGQLHYVGTEQRTVAGRPQTCYRFRVTGGKSPTDLWFDIHHRLVRQEFTEMGHHTVVELVSVRR